jgi:hypothetical protein
MPDGLGNERLLGWKVPVKGAVRQTGVLHDLGHRDRIEAAT